MSEELVDKVRGALIGSALGDAIGCYTEFLTSDDVVETYGPNETFSLIEPVTKRIEDYHRENFEDRGWTDDTDHTLLLVFSYLRNGSLVPDDFALRLHRWCRKGLTCLNRPPADIGSTIGGVLTDPNYPENPTAAARAYWIRTHKEIAPNGSLMRTIPVGIVCMNMSEAETFSNAIALGAVTHTDPRCAVAVAAVSGLVRGLLRGEVKTGADVNALVERAYAASPPNPPKEPFDLHAYADSLDALKLDYGRIGYVYKAFGAALWCLREVLDGRETYKSAILKVVRTGGDADTNATVAGGLLGAICGYNALPPEWRDGLEHREWYLQKIDNLCITLGLLEGKYDAEADPDTAFA